MKKFVVSWVLIVVMTVLLSACGGSGSYVCKDCGEETSKAYYDMRSDKSSVMCEDCARKYWMPLDYRTYRVK